MAACLPDVACYLLVLWGVERIEFAPGFTRAFPYKLAFCPYSHGLVGTVALALGFSLICSFVFRERIISKFSIVIAIAVLSHFVCDLIVHGPDLTLFRGDDPKVGFGLWDHPVMSNALEILIYAGGLWGCFSQRKPTGKFRRLGFILIGIALALSSLAASVLPGFSSPLMTAALPLCGLLAIVGLTYLIEADKVRIY